MISERDRRFTRLLEAHGASLARLAAVYTDGPADRDDLLQDISFAIWRALPAFRGDSSERTFVFRIAHNRGLTHRARGRRRRADPLDAAVEVADPRGDPLDHLEQALTRDRLLDAVRRLPEPLRQVTVLSLSGLTPGEIAEVLGITVNNAGVRLTRARRALRALL